MENLQGTDVATKRSLCSRCNKPLNKGLPRVYFLDGRYLSKRYMCFKCGDREIEETLNNLKNIKKEMKKLYKSKRKEILADNI